MSYEESLLTDFGKKFKRYRDKRMVFYLNNFNPTIFFREYKDFNIIGIMDKYTVCGKAYNKEILSYARVLELQTEVIIIAAEPVYYEIIRKRIAEFCRINDIELYTIDGVRLSVEGDFKQIKNVYYNLSTDLLKKMIGHYEVISFNIYDTLIMNRVLDEEDIYHLIGRKLMKKEMGELEFVHWRKQIEEDLKLIESYTLEEVYEAIEEKMQISSEQKELLLGIEKEVRRKIIVPRQEMVDIFNYAKEQGKNIFLIENSFLPEEYVKDLLEKCEISGYDKFLFSNQNEESENYRKILAYAENCRVLHIGRICTKEIQVKLMGKVSFCRILSAREMLTISVYNDYLKKQTEWYDRIKLGFFVSNIFNSPFGLYHTGGKGRVNKAYDISQLFIAPMVLDFMIWFIKKVEEDHIEKIFFASRDGYMVQNLYEKMLQKLKLNKMPESQYFMTSRLLSIVAQIHSADDIKNALKLIRKENAKEILSEWFMLKDTEIMRYDSGKYEDVDHYILAHTDQILRKAEKIRKFYIEYGKKCGIKDLKKIGFFDFVASGTCQMNVSKIFGKELYGYYFYRLKSADKEKQKLGIVSYISKNIKIEENALFMESIFTSPDASVSGFDENGNLVFAEERRSQKEIEYCMELQQGILDYVNEIIDMLGYIDDIFYEEINDYFLDFLYSSYTIIENENFKNYVVRDEFIRCESYVSNLYQY